MTDADHEYDQAIIVDLVNDPVVPTPHPIGAERLPGHCLARRRPRVIREQVDHCVYPPTSPDIEASQLA